MNSALLQNGTEIAQTLRTSSVQGAIVANPVKTTGDLMAILQQTPPRSFAMLKTTCGLLAAYFNLPGDQIPLNTIEAERSGFRQFLVSRRYSDNSIRTYVNQRSRLLKTARRFGWDPDDSASEEWKTLLVLARKKGLTRLARHFSRITKTLAR
jgi:hypothetical protein